ncbi:amidohydrolase [Ornithinibacillus bavariensis]|uniref:Peptidase n=1 Tax=Ornithinibacillus bavariensis TaxID=545502 RepID=A0A920C623_9BACI|nr:amidohydrolase [Ornithinibacillus bavariensis]GIO27340.1 peptidase [Ornithinibacillus bavariensis]
MREHLIAMLESRKDEIINIRRYLHEYPELSFYEKNTSQYIEEFYKGKDVAIQTNVGGGYGIIVTIKGGKPGKTIGLRADFDALPIQEETEVPFKSEVPGVMHACAHDGHTAYLMVLADCLIQLKDEIPGTIKIIHQPAEEVPPGGAIGMIASGLLDDLDDIFGIHLLPMGPAGVVGYNSGYVFPGRAYFKLKVQGLGGHGSSPHLANDAIVAGAYFVTAIQTVVSRRLNPFDMGVVTIGSFDGKGTFNVIKDRVELEGDVRAMTEETRALIECEIRRIARGVEEEFDVKCDLTYEPDYPPLYNNPGLTDMVAAALKSANDKDITEVKEFPPLSPSEDFAHYANRFPACFFYICCKPKGVEKPYFNHHPKFDINEDALLVAAKAVGIVVCSYYGID